MVSVLSNSNLKQKNNYIKNYFNQDIMGEILIISINDTVVKNLVNRSTPISILCLNSTGMIIETLFDLPAKSKIIIDISFKLESNEFRKISEVIWKREKNEKIMYGIRFVTNKCI